MEPLACHRSPPLFALEVEVELGDAAAVPYPGPAVTVEGGVVFAPGGNSVGVSETEAAVTEDPDGDELELFPPATPNPTR